MKTKPFVIPKQLVMKAYRRKYKRFRGGKKTRAGQYLARMAKTRPGLFAHWRMGVTGVRLMGAV